MSIPVVASTNIMGQCNALIVLEMLGAHVNPIQILYLNLVFLLLKMDFLVYVVTIFSSPLSYPEM